MKRTASDYAEQVRDDVLAAVRAEFADGKPVAYPTITTLARSLPHEPEDIETALRTLADVGDIALSCGGNAVLRVTWVQPSG